MADGIPSEMEKIKALDILEFWAVFDLWRQKIINETKAIKNVKHR